MEKWREGEGGKVVYAVVVQVNETKLLHTMSIYIYFNETLRCFDFSKQSFGPSPSLYSITSLVFLVQSCSVFSRKECSREIRRALLLPNVLNYHAIL